MVQIAGLRELQVDSVELLLQVIPFLLTPRVALLGPGKTLILLPSNCDGSDESIGQQHHSQLCSVSHLMKRAYFSTVPESGRQGVWNKEMRSKDALELASKAVIVFSVA